MFNDNGSFLLAMFEFFIFFAWIMCLFHVFGDLFRSRDLGAGAKTLWCLFVIFLPFLGVFGLRHRPWRWHDAARHRDTAADAAAAGRLCAFGRRRGRWRINRGSDRLGQTCSTPERSPRLSLTNSRRKPSPPPDGGITTRRAGAFKGANRPVEGEVPGLGRKWKPRLRSVGARWPRMGTSPDRPSNRTGGCRRSSRRPSDCGGGRSQAVGSGS